MCRLLAALLLTVAACSGDDSSSSGDARTRSTTRTTEPSEEGSAGSYGEVEFIAADGEPRSGRLFGAGDVGVVLSHMGRPGDSQDDWLRFADDLASNAGLLVLTYEGRRTLSETWNDVLGAVEYLRDNGAEMVVAGGASIGAMASLEAAIKPDSQINAVLWLAGVLHNSGYDFTEADVSGLACPMLVASGDQDAYGAADDARQLSDWTPGVSQLLIVEARQHGTDILTEADPSVADQLRETMSGFIETAANQPPATC
jgi:predicted alpha/beta-hydrolase family hydrolase